METYLAQYKSDFFTDVWIQTDSNYNKAVLTELQTRIKTLAEYTEITSFFYGDVNYELETFFHKKMKIQSAQDAIDSLEF